MTHFVRKSGGDGNGGQSRTDAWLTITYALGEISNGDTLIIGAGDYSGEALDVSSLTNIRILGDRHGTKTGDAGAVTVSSCTMTDDAYVEHITSTGDFSVTGDWTTLSSCTMGGDIIIGNGCRGCRALTCAITNSVLATNPDGLELLSLTILGNDVADPPLVITAGSGVSLRNCIVTSSANQYVISIAAQDRSVDFDNNLYWSGSGSFAENSETSEVFSDIAGWQRTGQDTDSRYENPLLTTFTPAATSPAIGMGDELGATDDITGRPRHLAQYDMGAVQSVIPMPIPSVFTERRFRLESPLMSSAWIDTLSEFQRWIAHFFGLDTEGIQITQGLTRQFIEIVDSDVTGLNDQIVNFHARIDNIKGNARSLEYRKWE